MHTCAHLKQWNNKCAHLLSIVVVCALLCTLILAHFWIKLIVSASTPSQCTCPNRRDVPSVYGTGFAKSDSTPCLPVPQGCWGPLGRSKQADYWVPIFEKISVWACLATAVESARFLQTDQNVAQSPSHAHCTRRTRACWKRIIFFGSLVHERWPAWAILCLGLSCHGSRIGQNHPGRLKLCPIALPRALYKTRPRVLKLDAYFQCAGAPKMTPWSIFDMPPYCRICIGCSTN
jgi:hypothetical protein